MIKYVDRNVQRLLHMIEGIKRINSSLEGVSREGFLSDEMRQSAVAFDISTIGESAANISEEFQKRDWMMPPSPPAKDVPPMTQPQLTLMPVESP